MAQLKSLHKYQLQLIALNSIIDSCFKELLSYLVTTITQLGEEQIHDVDKALANLLKSSPHSTMEMHFVASYPVIQDLVYTDIKTMEIKDEIRIYELDALVICDLLLHQPALRANLDHENLTKHIKLLRNSRILAASENNMIFWERFDLGEGIKLSFSDDFYTWPMFWRENKVCITKIIEFLTYQNIFKDTDCSKHLEELNLFASWSKQEILQNWYRPLVQQYNALAFLQKLDKKITTHHSKSITLRVSDNPPTSSDASNTGWIASVITYIKSYFVPYVEQSATSILSFDLDGEVAKMVSETLKELVTATFGGGSFVDIMLYQTTKGVELFDDDEDVILPLTIEFENEEKRILSDPFAASSQKLWSEIGSEVICCIKKSTGIAVLCIRTGWHLPSKINILLSKVNNDSWYPTEVSSVIENLKGWKFPYKFSIKTNPEIMENIATMKFRIQTANARYFDVMDKFATIINEKASSMVLNYQRLKKDDIIETLGLTSSLTDIKETIQKLSSNRYKNRKEMDILNESHTSLELRSPRCDGGSSSRLSTPRVLVSPKRNGSHPERSFSQESSALKNLANGTSEEFIRDIVDAKNDGDKKEGTKIKQHSSISKRKQIKMKETKNKKDEHKVKNGKSVRAPTLTEDWMKLKIVKEFVLKPALLSVLHNDNNVLQSTSIFPRNPKKLYEGVRHLRQKYPKSFDVWRKNDLNTILLPTDGAGESHSNLWSIDMIYFMMRISKMVPAPHNGRQQIKKAGEAAIDEISFCCMEIKALKDEINQGRISCVDDEMLKRVEHVLKGLRCKSDVFNKLKSATLIEHLLS